MEDVIGIGVLLQTDKGTFLLQERDLNAPLHPGRIAAFGGGIEGGEDAVSCALREMWEELRLHLEESELRTLAILPTHHVAGGYVHMFIVSGIDRSQLVLCEGKRIIECTKDAAFLNEAVTDFTKEVLRLV